MNAVRFDLRNAAELASALKKIDADARSLPFFENRRDLHALLLPEIDVRAANVIKQEMLSVGADAAVSRHCVDCTAKTSKVLLIGTKKQLLAAADKITAMKCWGFDEISAAIKKAADGKPTVQKAKLPNGNDLEFGDKSLIMAILNLTDDSFYASSRIGGNLRKAVENAAKAIEDGADILDFGAESTRPGSSRVSEVEEVKRISAAIEAVRKEFPKIPISVDTTRTSAARAALEKGADIINDVSGLTFEPDIAKAAADFDAMYVLMHMRGTTETMSSLCDYEALLPEINGFFARQIELAESFGLARDRIILDPGLGFAKNYEQNLYILKHLETMKSFGLPILIGHSRKSFIGTALGKNDPADRLFGTTAVTALSCWAGAGIIRVHDVAENRQTIDMIAAIKGSECF